MRLTVVFLLFWAYLGCAARAAPADAADLVAKNSYSFVLSGTELSGPGATFLRQATAGAEFVLAGETHHDHFIPLFDLALLSLLHGPNGLNQVVVEQDPIGIEAILQPPLRGDAAAIGQFLKRYPTLLGFASDEDLIFLAGASRLLPGKAPIWGIEQAQSPVRYLELLLPLAPTTAARTMDLALLSRARQMEVTRADFGKFIALDPTALDRLRALRATYRPVVGSQADFLLTGLAKSAEIYSYYRRAAAGEPVGLFNNTVREAWLKAGFTARYRAALARGEHPRLLFKFGDNHMIRGLNFTGAFSLSTYLHEVAIYQGTQAYGIGLMSFGGYDSAPGAPWMRNLLPPLPPGPVVIDAQALRPQWKLLAAGLSPDDQATLRMEIFGFEALVLFPNSQKATWNLTGFPIP